MHLLILFNLSWPTNISAPLTLLEWNLAWCMISCLMCAWTFKEFGDFVEDLGHITKILLIASKQTCQPPSSSMYTLLCFQRVLTASMPDSCMPILMTTTLSTCHRTDSSSNSFHTDSVSCDDRERCSSCISSISAWMLHLALYHFRAERQDRKQRGYSTLWKDTTAQLKHKSLQLHQFMYLRRF